MASSEQKKPAKKGTNKGMTNAAREVISGMSEAANQLMKIMSFECFDNQCYFHDGVMDIKYANAELNHYQAAIDHYNNRAYTPTEKVAGDEAVMLQLAWDTNRIANALEAIALDLLEL